MTRPKAKPGTTFAFALTLFVAVLALLAWQVRAGRDPALNAQSSALVASAPAHRVLVRVVQRRVIDDKVVYVPVTTASGAGSSGSSAAPQVASTSAPVVSSAPAPAAAPAPAPVQTHTS